jgi:hypothetical protein
LLPDKELLPAELYGNQRPSTLGAVPKLTELYSNDYPDGVDHEDDTIIPARFFA